MFAPKQTMRVSYDRLRRVLLRPFVLGSIDGLVTSFVILASGFAGEVAKSSLMLIGLASLVADAFSMGVSEYLSSRTEESIGDAFVMGAACFTSFLVFGAVPLCAYAVVPDEPNAQRVSAVVAFGLMLLVVAGLRAFVTPGASPWRSVVEVVLLGASAGAIAYGVAVLYHDA